MHEVHCSSLHSIILLEAAGCRGVAMVLELLPILIDVLTCSLMVVLLLLQGVI